MSPHAAKPYSGSRPGEPVRRPAAEGPGCELCTWSHVLAVWSSPVRQEGHWELKYINSMCHLHARLRAA